MSGIAEIQGRIAEIQSTMATLATLNATTAAPAAASSATSATATSFARALAAAAPAASGAAASGTTTAANGAGGAGTGQALVTAAEKYVGVPYLWGGTNPATGLDCSGFVQRALADVGVDAPRVARDQARLGTPVASLAAAKPGDLLIFENGAHVGIYVGGGQMIDSSKPGKNIAVRAVYATPTSIRRVLPEAAVPVTAVGTAAVPAAAAVGGSATTTAADLQRYALTLLTEPTAA